MKTGILLLAFVIITACVSVSEKELEEREYRDAEWRAQFLEARAQCRSSGGLIVIQNPTGLSVQKKIPGPYDLVSCQKRDRTGW